jgi:hypothetical protein
MASLFLALAATLALGDDTEPTPKFEAKFRKTDDKLEASVEKAGVVWKITCPSGISGATVDLKSGPAPKKITIRLVKFQNLEMFRIEDGNLKLAGQLDRKGKKTTYYDDKGKPGADPKTAAVSLSVEQKDGNVDVVLTCSKPGKKWTLNWIDAYRK